MLCFLFIYLLVFDYVTGFRHKFVLLRLLNAYSSIFLIMISLSRFFVVEPDLIWLD